jgi:hypothetical protein
MVGVLEAPGEVQSAWIEDEEDMYFVTIAVQWGLVPYEWMESAV